MQRSFLPLALALFGLGIFGCLSDLEDICQTDADCPGGGRCAVDGGLRYCVPGPGDDGSGGVGGKGGSGGSGGKGGSGGSSEFEATVELKIAPDAELAEFLGTADRPLGALSLRYESGGVKREVEIPLEKPTDLPIASVEASLPLASAAETLSLRVEAQAYLHDETTLALFASGQATGEFMDGETTSLSVSLALDPHFDWDGDKDPDAKDCYPDDPNRHHEAFEVCDGEPQACGSQFCFIKLKENQTVRDLACSVSERKCAVVIGEGESGIVRIYESEFPSEPVEVENVDNPLGVAWSETNGSGATLLISVRDRIYLSDTTGSLLSGTVTPSGDLLGPIEVSTHGNFAVALESDRTSLQAFDPEAAAYATTSVGCDDPESSCRTISLKGLSDTDDEPVAPNAKVSIAQIYHSMKENAPNVYCSFTGDPRIALIRVRDLVIRDNDSGLLPAQSDNEPRAVKLFSNDQRIAIVGGTSPELAFGAWAVPASTINGQGEMSSMILPPDSCPAALDAKRNESALLMADDCKGMLWELPLDEEGKPTGKDFVPYPLKDCDKPFVLASLPADGEEGPLTFVGCEGEEHILVHGRH